MPACRLLGQGVPLPKLPLIKFIDPRINRKLVATITLPVLALGGLAMRFNSVFFYNEAGQMTHVRRLEPCNSPIAPGTQCSGRNALDNDHLSLRHPLPIPASLLIRLGAVTRLGLLV